MTHIKITSFNVRGINNKHKRVDIIDYLNKKQENIYCLQDIHCGPDNQNTFKEDWEGDMYIASGTNASRGVAILFRKNFEYKILDSENDQEGNYIALKIKMIDTEITLINIYGPNNDNPRFYDELSALIDRFQTATIILCGDWNLVQDQQLDTKNYLRENNIRARNKVLQMKEIHDLHDPWRIQNPDEKQYTWLQRNPHKMSRLDFFLVSSDILAITDKSEIKPGYRSDHSIINLTLEISSQTKGKGFWKLNTSLLHDQEYATIIKTVIKDNIIRYAKPNQNLENLDISFTISDQLFWETLKMEFRQATIPYAGKKKKNAQERETKLLNEIESLNIVMQDNENIETIERIKNLKDDLENICKDKIRGMIIRSKVQWLEEGEKPTNFFASLEKKNYTTKLISKLNIRGNIIQNQNSILNETANFYKDLYTTKIDTTNQEQNNVKFLKCAPENKLNETQKLSCEGNISIEEIKNTLKQMKHDKSPGIDGIPVEFYKKNWIDLGHFLVRAIRESFFLGNCQLHKREEL